MATWLKKLGYRVAGLPNALRSHRETAEPLQTLRRSYRRYYWRPRNFRNATALVAAPFAWPLLFAYFAFVSVRANGTSIRERTGKSAVRQLAEQIGYYVRSAILPPWYYVFSLHDPGGRERAPFYLQRFETKVGLYDLLNAGARSPLTDKAAFADHCRRHDLPTIPLLLTIEDGRLCWPVGAPEALPDADLFCKPVAAQGGRGAERWDNIAPGRFSGPAGQALGAGELLDRLVEVSGDRAILVQPRLVNHPAVVDLSNGALCTVRALTCLDENDRPELLAAVYRMAVGENVTVDNFHAGGIAATVDITTGELSKASDLGRRRSIGWLASHPQSKARIEGRKLPMWADLKALVERAHCAFSDRVVLGWDVALLADGPILVEGNVRPDLDILQRLAGRGLGDGRTGELLAHHVRRRAADC